jgi:hypothetical protein
MHMRTLLVASVIGLSLACIAGLASGQQIYKWKDASGVTHFSQTPPNNGAHYSKMTLTQEPEVSSNPPSAASAETDASAPRNESRQATATGDTQPNTSSNRAKLCQQLSDNVALLQGKQPVVTGGSNGKQEVMSDSARQQQLATAHAQQAQYCAH